MAYAKTLKKVPFTYANFKRIAQTPLVSYYSQWA